MANLVKKDYDTRTFPEICSSLAEQQWLDLKYDIMSKLRKTEQTVLNWKHGKTMPAAHSERKDIAKIIGSLLDIKTTPSILFRS